MVCRGRSAMKSQDSGGPQQRRKVLDKRVKSHEIPSETPNLGDDFILNL